MAESKLSKHFRALLLVLGSKGSDENVIIEELRKLDAKRERSGSVAHPIDGKGLKTFHWTRGSNKHMQDIKFTIFEVEEQKEIVPVS